MPKNPERAQRVPKPRFPDYVIPPQPRLPLEATIGEVSEIQKKPYEPQLKDNETLRIFNPTHMPELLGAISGERGKDLRATYASTKEGEYTDDDRRDLYHKIIRVFFATREPAQKVRLLDLRRPDGTEAPPNKFVYPVALSKSEGTPDIVK